MMLFLWESIFRTITAFATSLVATADHFISTDSCLYPNNNFFILIKNTKGKFIFYERSYMYSDQQDVFNDFFLDENHVFTSNLTL